MKTTLPVLILSLFLLTACGNSDKSSKDTKANTGQTADNKSKNTKGAAEQIMTRKWKESFDEMFPKDAVKDYNEFELKELKNASNNSFYDFKADKSYTITKPDEDPGKGKWELSNDNKTLILSPAQGSKIELEVQSVTAEKLQLKVKGEQDILVLIPA